MTSSYEIPIVLPVMRFRIGAHGQVEATIDGEPFEAATDRVRGRASVRPMVDHYAQSARTPVRVEIVEEDGTTFTDIVAPTEVAATPTSLSGDKPQCGAFKPGEPVLVAAIVDERPAGADGGLNLRLPPAMLSAQRVALIGRESAAVVILGEPR